MRSPLGFGTAVVAALAAAGVAFLVTPGDDVAQAGDRSVAGEQPGAAQVAQEFWDLALDGRCAEATQLMWWPADREARREAYARVCVSADVPDGVDIGEPQVGGSTDVPFGATDYVTVPVVLQRDDGLPVVDELGMVRVDGSWFVIR